MPTAGLRHAPDLEPATQIMASRVNETDRQPRNPSFVGFVFLVFTSRLIVTNTKVQIASTKKTLLSFTTYTEGGYSVA